MLRNAVTFPYPHAITVAIQYSSGFSNAGGRFVHETDCRDDQAVVERLVRKRQRFGYPAHDNDSPVTRPAQRVEARVHPNRDPKRRCEPSRANADFETQSVPR